MIDFSLPLQQWSKVPEALNRITSRYMELRDQLLAYRARAVRNAWATMEPILDVMGCVMPASPAGADDSRHRELY